MTLQLGRGQPPYLKGSPTKGSIGLILLFVLLIDFWRRKGCSQIGE